MKTILPLTLIALVLNGCAMADFTPYQGAQQNWPISPGTFVDTKYVVPVFYGPPPRPYRVLGYLSATTAPIRAAGTVEFMARRAREMGGNGLILISKGSQYAGTYTSGSASAVAYGNSAYASGSSISTPVYWGTGTAVVIHLGGAATAPTGAANVEQSRAVTLTEVSTGTVCHGSFNLAQRNGWVVLPDGTRLTGNISGSTGESGGAGSAVLTSPDGKQTMTIQVDSNPAVTHGSGTAKMDDGREFKMTW
jgi:hypothetical protein